MVTDVVYLFVHFIVLSVVLKFFSPFSLVFDRMSTQCKKRLFLRKAFRICVLLSFSPLSGDTVNESLLVNFQIKIEPIGVTRKKSACI